MFFQAELSFNDEVYITNMRHKAALVEAKEEPETGEEEYRTWECRRISFPSI